MCILWCTTDVIFPCSCVLWDTSDVMCSLRVSGVMAPGHLPAQFPGSLRTRLYDGVVYLLRPEGESSQPSRSPRVSRKAARETRVCMTCRRVGRGWLSVKKLSTSREKCTFTVCRRGHFSWLPDIFGQGSISSKIYRISRPNYFGL